MKNPGGLIALLILVVITIIVLYRRDDIVEKIWLDFHNWSFWAALLMMGGWSLFQLYLGKINKYDKEDDRVEATKKAMMAFIIAYLSRLDLSFTAFWLVWVMAFYMDGWV